MGNCGFCVSVHFFGVHYEEDSAALGAEVWFHDECAFFEGCSAHVTLQVEILCWENEGEWMEVVEVGEETLCAVVAATQFNFA